MSFCLCSVVACTPGPCSLPHVPVMCHQHAASRQARQQTVNTILGSKQRSETHKTCWHCCHPDCKVAQPFSVRQGQCTDQPGIVSSSACKPSIFSCMSRCPVGDHHCSWPCCKRLKPRALLPLKHWMHVPRHQVCACVRNLAGPGESAVQPFSTLADSMQGQGCNARFCSRLSLLALKHTSFSRALREPWEKPVQQGCVILSSAETCCLRQAAADTRALLLTALACYQHT